MPNFQFQFNCTSKTSPSNVVLHLQKQNHYIAKAHLARIKEKKKNIRTKNTQILNQEKEM